MPIQIDLGNSKSSQQHAKVKALDGFVVGIDLGTTNSLVARADAQADIKGRPQILPDANGHPLVPSVVAIDADGKIECVGRKAFALRSTRPRDVLYSVKRLMGRSLKDLGQEVEQIPYELVSDALGAQALIKVRDRILSPVEISAQVLATLKKQAEARLGGPVDRAVITVPAYFDDAQRTATKAAGRLAGLEVLRVLNEPTAAALAYGWSHERPGIVVVYDMGGGTFDLSILRIEENVYEVLSTAGDTHLGGDDFDQALANLALEELTKLDPNLKSRLADADARRSVYAALLSESERVKRELSDKESTYLRYESYELQISRAAAELRWRPLVERSLASCARALEDARLDISQIEDVLLVGGSTRVPLVRKLVEEFFKRKPNDSLNPDEAVALGAALQAEALSGAQASDRLLLDVIPLSLGIETMGGAVSKLIHRNSTLPAEAREVYTNHAEHQTAFDIHIVQGERELVKDCRSLARFRLRGLSPAPAGFHRIEVLFRIDANGILNVRARDLRSGKAHEVEVRPSFGISDDELYELLESSETHAEADMVARQLVDLRVEADTVIKAADRAIANAGHLVSHDQLAAIKMALDEVKTASAGEDKDRIEKALADFNELSMDLAEKQVNLALTQALAGQSARASSPEEPTQNDAKTVVKTET